MQKQSKDVQSYPPLGVEGFQSDKQSVRLILLATSWPIWKERSMRVF